MKDTLPFENINRDVLIKKDVQPTDRYGTRPHERSIPELLLYGVINIDKPKGPTSHQVADHVQKILDVKKAGHSGTLDPKVTGVLPVALHKATKAIQVLLKAGKEYVAIMHLHDTVKKGDLRKAIKKFTGKIRQLPPIKSSVKRDWRYREVYYVNVLETIDNDVLFIIGCEAGTYIRKWIHDLGQYLGVGAHMAELRRTKAGPFQVSDAYSLQDLTDAYHYYTHDSRETEIRKIIRPMEDIVSHIPKVWVLDSTVNALCHGTDLKVPGIARIHQGIEKEQMVAVMTLKDELIALGSARMNTKQIMKEEKGVAVKIDKVLMEPGTYPKKPANPK